MPTQESTELARRLQLALTIDGKRAATDPFKLPLLLGKDVTDDLGNLEETDAETGPEEGQRVTAVGKKRLAFNEIERQLHGEYRFIAALDEGIITDEERQGVFESYLWKGGNIGHFDDARCIELAKQAIKVDEENLVPLTWRCPDVRLQRIKAQLAIIEEEEDTATGGGRQMANKVRNTAVDLASTTLLRVRFWYCCASRDADQTPELARIEFQPRRNPSPAAETTPLPVVTPPVV